MLDPISLAERGLIPDPLIRRGIRRQLQDRLAQEGRDDIDASEQRRREFREALRHSEIAINTDDANDQHYEVPAALFELMLGRRLKYSSCWWGDGIDNIDDAEEAMLELYVCEPRVYYRIFLHIEIFYIEIVSLKSVSTTKN